MTRTSSLTLATVAIAAATLVQHASAHGYMLSPVVTWPKDFSDQNSPCGRLDVTKLAKEVDADYLGAKRAAAAIATTSDKTLRTLIRKNAVMETTKGIKADPDCGWTVLTGAKQAAPDEFNMQWGHPGPCEAWCDDTRVYVNEDCNGNKVGKVKVDKAKCANAKRFQVIYVNAQVSNYEVYANCVPLSGSGSGGGAAVATPEANATPAKTPATTTAAPKTSAPATAGEATEAPKTKCKRRLR